MKVAAFVLVLLCGATWCERENSSFGEKYEAPVRQSRGQSPVRAPQQALSRELSPGQQVKYITQPQQVNYDNDITSVHRSGNPLVYNVAANPTSNLNIEEQQNYDFAGGKGNAQLKTITQRIPYSPASEVSQFRYSSPLVKYSNLGVLSQTTGNDADRTLQKPESQQSRTPQYLTQSQTLQSLPGAAHHGSENYVSASSLAQQPTYSAAQQIAAEEPTTYEALLNRYHTQQQQQQQQQQLESGVFQREYARVPGFQSTAQSAPQIQQAEQEAQLRSQLAANLSPNYAKGRVHSTSSKSPVFAEQLANFLGQFSTGGNRAQNYALSQAEVGPQKFNNDAILQQRIPSTDYRQKQYLSQQGGRSIGFAVAANLPYHGQQSGQILTPQQIQIAIPQPAVKASYQSPPANYPTDIQPEYSRQVQQVPYSPAPQSASVASQGAYVVGPHNIHSAAIAPASLNGISPSAHLVPSHSRYSVAPKAATPQVVYANAPSQNDYASAPSQNVYVPTHRAAAGPASSAHSAYV